MNTPRFFLRAGIVAVVAIMLIFLAGAPFDRALSANAAPFAQDGTGYPSDFETESFDEGYPFETDTFETDIPFDETPFDFETDEVPPPNITITPTLTSTIPSNAFLTESAEMSGGLVTPPPSETPGPTITVYHTPTAATATPKSTLSLVSAKSGSRVDWGYFSLGFAVPLLAACGLVLYLLDRRPDLFRPRK